MVLNLRALKNLKRALNNFNRSTNQNLFFDVFGCGHKELIERVNEAMLTPEEQTQAFFRRMRKRPFLQRLNDAALLLQDRKHFLLANEVDKLGRTYPKTSGYQGRLSQLIRTLMERDPMVSSGTNQNVRDILVGKLSYQEALARFHRTTK